MRCQEASCQRQQPRNRSAQHCDWPARDRSRLGRPSIPTAVVGVTGRTDQATAPVCECVRAVRWPFLPRVPRRSAQSEVISNRISKHYSPGSVRTTSVFDLAAAISPRPAPLATMITGPPYGRRPLCAASENTGFRSTSGVRPGRPLAMPPWASGQTERYSSPALTPQTGPLRHEWPAWDRSRLGRP
jgi:hypothetical protein